MPKCKDNWPIKNKLERDSLKTPLLDLKKYNKQVFLRENHITIHKGFVANWELIAKQDKKVPETVTLNRLLCLMFILYPLMGQQAKYSASFHVQQKHWAHYSLKVSL